MKINVAWQMLRGLLWLAAGGVALIATLAAFAVGIVMAGWYAVVMMATVIIICLLWVIARYVLGEGTGFRTVLRMGADGELWWHACAHCTAGVQTLLRSGMWGPIPVAWRLIRPGDRSFRAPLANVRDCPYCQGLGRKLLPFPPRGQDVPEQEERDEEKEL